MLAQDSLHVINCTLPGNDAARKNISYCKTQHGEMLQKHR